MKLEYQFSSARVQCRECSKPLKDVEHPVLLQDEETRLDLCYSCFSKMQSDMQYLARWKHKGHSPAQAEEDKNRLDRIASDMANYFASSPSRFSLLYHINVMKVLYLERLKVVKEICRELKDGKLLLWFRLSEKEFYLVYEPFSEDLMVKVAEEFSP